MTAPLVPVIVSLAIAALPATTHAAQRGKPGSLLLFPEYQAQPGIVCLITVTNTNEDASNGAVQTRWTYVDGQACTVLDRTEQLTPGDTVTANADTHAFNNGSGYMYVYATDPLTAEPKTHNHLIGHSTVIDGIGATSYAIEPYVFRGLISADVNQDGVRNLNGVEYQHVPDEIFVPRFFGQGPSYQSQLIIVDLTGSAGATSSVEFTIYNDNEESFSAIYSFGCWTKVPLTQISGVFDNSFLLNSTNHDQAEFVSALGQESGWFRVDGVQTVHTTGQVELDPAILVQLVDVSPNWRSALPPSHLGFQANGAPNPAPPSPSNTRLVRRDSRPPVPGGGQ